MIAIPVSTPKPTRADYLLAGGRAYLLIDDAALMLLCWLTCELARGRGWRKMAAANKAEAIAA